MQPSCTVFHSARSRKHGRRHVKPTHIPWSGRLHFARCFLVSMIDRRPDPRRIQQLHVDGMAPDIRARKDHARATSRRVCTPSSVGRKIATPWRAARPQNGCAKSKGQKDRTSPSTGRHYCSTGAPLPGKTPGGGHTRETRGTRARITTRRYSLEQGLEVQKHRTLRPGCASKQIFTSCDLGLP